MELYVQAFFSGITVGSIYALVGLGFTMVFVSSYVLNVAQGEFVMLGGMLMVTLVVTLGLPWPVAFIGTMVAVAVVGAVFERVGIRPRRLQPHFVIIMITIGAVLLFQGTAMLVWGRAPQTLPAALAGEPLRVAGAIIRPQAILILVAAVVILGLFTLFLGRTALGRAMRACAENQMTASLMGVNVGFVMLLSFAISAGIGAAAGALITPLTTMSFYTGLHFTFKAITAAILGGMDRYSGPVVGGLLLGLIEEFSGVGIHGLLKDAIALSLLILVLLFRPQGILGRIKV